MPSSSYGLVVEGEYDYALEVLVQRICGERVPVFVLPAGGRTQVKRKFTGLLRRFEHISNTGGPVGKALVICDSDLSDPKTVEADLAARLGRHTYSFPDGISFHAVKQELETWLMADLEAINALLSAGKRTTIQGPAGHLEDLPDPKRWLRRLLDEADLLYTPQVCSSLAGIVDLAALRARCPLFTEFEQKVLDP